MILVFPSLSEKIPQNLHFTQTILNSWFFWFFRKQGNVYWKHSQLVQMEFQRNAEFVSNTWETSNSFGNIDTYNKGLIFFFILIIS